MGLLDRLWSAISETLFDDMRTPGAGIEDARRRAQAMAPVVWLLGKTGAGKMAIVAALTGDPRAEIGQGFEPCTRTAAFYDVPPEAPLLRFLDTRGLGEVQYDAANDIAKRFCHQINTGRSYRYTQANPPYPLSPPVRCSSCLTKSTRRWGMGCCTSSYSALRHRPMAA